MKKEKPVEWRYKTEHVDLMLWQYAIGIEQMFNSTHSVATYSGDVSHDHEQANKLVTARHDHLEKVFDVAPSFYINFVTKKDPNPDVSTGQIEIVKLKKTEK